MPYANPEERIRYDHRRYLKNRRAIKRAVKKWREKNPEKLSQYRKKWREKNPEYQKKYVKKNHLKIQKRKTNWQRERYQTNFMVRLSGLVRARIRKAIRGVVKSESSLGFLGCSISQLRAYLEKQFRPGMTWKNYGPVWHVDHIRPCASFDLRIQRQQRECFHFSNLQPLFAQENFKKRASYAS